MTVSDPLEKLQQSFRSIQSTNFDDAQMFTNSIVNAPAITTLLKDPTMMKAYYIRLSNQNQ